MSKAVAQTIPFQEYRSLPGLNFSRLKRMLKSALDYHVNARKESDALDIGRAIHVAVLEPERWLEFYSIYEGDRKAGEEWEEFKEAHEGADILSVAEAQTCSAIARAVKLHPVASTYFETGVAETSIFWNHELAGGCKSRLDWYSDTIVLDLKSARDITQRGLSNQAAQLDYFAQLAFYHDAARALDGRDRKAIIVAVEKVPPFDVGCYSIPDYALQAGRARYQDWMLKLKRCQAEDVWPGVTEVETELVPPEWYCSEWDDAKLIVDGVEISV